MKHHYGVYLFIMFHLEAYMFIIASLINIPYCPNIPEQKRNLRNRKKIRNRLGMRLMIMHILQQRMNTAQEIGECQTVKALMEIFHYS